MFALHIPPDGDPLTTSDASTIVPPYVDPSICGRAHDSAAGTLSATEYETGTEREDSDDDEYQFYDDSERNVKHAMGSYMYKRNIFCTDVSCRATRAVIEYANLKYIENNFRSIGLSKPFNKNIITQAQMEFESFEKWFNCQTNVMEKNFVRVLRLPLFCHLFMSIYSKPNHEHMIKFLNEFKYLFGSSKVVLLLQELKKYTGIINLSPCLSLFRKNRFVFSVSPEFLSSLYGFLQHHLILKTVFQEWFDINYETNENPETIFEYYYNQINNRLKLMQNNGELKHNASVNNDSLLRKKLNSIQNTQSTSESDSENNYFKDQLSSSSQSIILQEPYSNSHQSKYNKVISCISRRKHQDNTKSRGNKNVHKNKCMIQDCYLTSMDESECNKNFYDIGDSSLPRGFSTDETDSNKSEVYKKQQNSSKLIISKERIVLKFYQKPNRLNIICGIMNNKLEDSNDDGNPEMNNEQKQMFINNKGRRKNKYDRRKSINNNSSSSESSSEDSSADSSSKNSISDEDAVKHKYIRHLKKKNAQQLSFFSTYHLKLSYATKIDQKNLNEDLNLCSTRQITLTNCNKLLCSILTSDHKYVAAGSLDSLIYLWERSNLPTESEVNNVLRNSKNENSQNTNSLPSEESKNYIELLDKSSANILRGHGGSIFDLAELPSAKVLLSASNDKTFRAWDLKSKICLEVFNEYEHRTWCIAACPYTLQVASGSCDGAGCLWFLNYKRPLRIFTGHFDDILVIKFHPNQVLLASGSADKTIRIFELITGECQRLLIGHTDYVTCLEFHSGKPNILASACGAGEIIVWDLPSGEALWKMKLDKVLFSDLVWLTDDLLLASLTTGTILKCDTTENYVNSTKRVKGFSTKFHRLMSLKIVDTIVYTIGTPGNSSTSKPSIKRHTRASKRVKNEPKKSQLHQQEHEYPRNTSPLSKLLSPQQTIEKNVISKKPILGLNSAAMNNSMGDLQYQLTINSKNTTIGSQDFLQMNLQRSPFNLTSDEAAKLNSDYQSNSIRLVQKSSIKPVTTLQNSLVSPIPKNIQTHNSNPLQINLQSTNIQFQQQCQQILLPTSKDVFQQNVSLQSQITNKQQHEPSNNQLTMNLNFPQLQLQNPTTNTEIGEQQQLQQQNHKETNLAANMIVQQQQLLQHCMGNTIQLATSSVQQQQQIPPVQPVVRPKLTTQKTQKNVVCHDQQQLQLQHHIGGSNVHIANKNVHQQPQFQQIRSNILLAKMNIQQLQSQQPTNIQLGNKNVSQQLGENISRTNPQTSEINVQHLTKPSPSLSTSGVPIKVSIRQKKPKMAIRSSSLEKMPPDDYERLRQAVMTSLVQNNPELFSRGQTVIGEIKRSQSTTQFVDLTKSNSQTDSQKDENPKN